MTDESRPRWWMFPWREIVSTMVGAFILLWQTTLEDNPSALLVGAGLALLGVAGSGALQRAVKRANGKG